MIDILNESTEQEHRKLLEGVPGLKELVKEYHKQADDKLKYFLMEFALHGLAEFSQLSKHHLATGTSFKDLLSSMFSMPGPGGEDDEDDDFNT
jgi:magnesium chelatase subunit I